MARFEIVRNEKNIHGIEVRVDGQVIEGVREVSFEASADEIPVARIEVISTEVSVDMDAEVEYKLGDAWLDITTVEDRMKGEEVYLNRGGDKRRLRYRSGEGQ